MPALGSVSPRPRRRLRWPWLLLALFVTCGTTCAGGIGWLALRGPKPPQNATLVIDLRDGLMQVTGSGWNRLLQSAPTPLADLQRALVHARNDDGIERVTVLVGNLGEGFGEISHVVELLRDFSQSRKPIEVIYQAEQVDENELLFTTVADEVIAASHMTFSWDGLVAQTYYYRNLLQKLGLGAQFVAFKEYKSAIEPYTRDSMSTAARESLTGLLADLWQNLEQRLCESRDACGHVLSEMSGQPFFGATLARDQRRLIDRVDTIHAVLRERETITVAHYLDVLGKGDHHQPHIAIIEARGMIVMDTGDGLLDNNLMVARDLSKRLLAAAKDDNVKGVVLYVDSPGGSVVASEAIAQSIAAVQREADKPVVVVMGSVAASGGYWIASGADAIVASPLSITGSIGVYFGSFYSHDLLSTVGITTDSVKTAPHADWQSQTTPWTSEQEQAISYWIKDTYNAFVDRVASTRKQPVQAIESIARGRVWTGTQALEHGLIDQLGGLSHAILACNRAIRQRTSDERNDEASSTDSIPSDRGETADLPGIGFSGEDRWRDLLGSPGDLAQLGQLLAQMTANPVQSESALIRAVHDFVRQNGHPARWALMPAVELH